MALRAAKAEEAAPTSPVPERSDGLRGRPQRRGVPTASPYPARILLTHPQRSIRFRSPMEPPARVHPLNANGTCGKGSIHQQGASHCGHNRDRNGSERMMISPVKNLLVCAILSACSTIQAQTPPGSGLIVPCAACPQTGQTPAPPSGATPLMEFLDAPEPLSLGRFLNQAGPAPGKPAGPAEKPLRWTQVVRVVRTSPLVVEVLAVLDGPAPPGQTNSCGLQTIALADARLKPDLARLKFNQIVRAELTYGGNHEFPHSLYLSGLSPAASGAVPAAGCPNRSGLLISYRGAVEVVNVYNDGTILYRDEKGDAHGAERLAGEELASLLRTFGTVGFDRVDATFRPMDRVPDRDSLTLICARDQYVALPGKEAALAPLLDRVRSLKDRATAQTSYLLRFEDKAPFTILEWPYPQLPPDRLGPGRSYGEELAKQKLPREFLSRLCVAGRQPNSPPVNGRVFWSSAGQLYRVFWEKCPNCGEADSFQFLRSEAVSPLQALLAERARNRHGDSSAMVLIARGGVRWPLEWAPRLAEVGAGGLIIPPEEFSRHAAYYSELVKLGSSGLGIDVLEEGNLFRGVRICRVDPRAPRTRCTEAYADKP